MLNILAKPKRSVSKCALVHGLLLFDCIIFTFLIDDAIVSSTDQYYAMEELYILRYVSMTLVHR